MLAEIYLPKKARFQGQLYQTLSDGFDLQKVRHHLVTHEEEIRSFFQDYYFDEFPDGVVDTMGRVMSGYSLYEVDGVFFSEEAGTAVEERTQIVRIMLRPARLAQSLDSVPDLKRRAIREYLHFSGNRSEFATDFLGRVKEAEGHREAVLDLARSLRRWEFETALFVFGYVVFKLCQHIRQLKDDSDVTEEEEIWVTSFWNLVINRVVKVSAPT